MWILSPVRGVSAAGGSRLLSPNITAPPEITQSANQKVAFDTFNVLRRTNRELVMQIMIAPPIVVCTEMAFQPVVSNIDKEYIMRLCCLEPIVARQPLFKSKYLLPPTTDFMLLTTHVGMAFTPI
jgi:hypothetical protein